MEPDELAFLKGLYNQKDNRNDGGGNVGKQTSNIIGHFFSLNFQPYSEFVYSMELLAQQQIRRPFSVQVIACRFQRFRSKAITTAKGKSRK